MNLLWITLTIIGGGLVLLILNHSDGETFGIENNAFASTLYYGVWALVVGAALLGSGMRLGSIARNIAVWLLVLLALVAGYQYRYELQDVASRVTAGLVPGSPLSIRDGDGVQTVVLEKLSNGHFEARGSVDGATIRFVVDTGATSTVLTAEDATAAGFDPETLSFNIPVSTANGMARAARVTAAEVRIGSIARNRLPLLVTEPGQLGESLLGMNFIGTLSGFDVRGDRLILRD
jgi:aspartyl protease family protein